MTSIRMLTNAIVESYGNDAIYKSTFLLKQFFFRKLSTLLTKTSAPYLQFFNFRLLMAAM